MPGNVIVNPFNLDFGTIFEAIVFIARAIGNFFTGIANFLKVVAELFVSFFKAFLSMGLLLGDLPSFLVALLSIGLAVLVGNIILKII